MMAMHDHTDYQRSLIPGGLKRDVKDTIEVAVMLGWKMHLSSDQSVTIISHDERKKYHFSVRTGRNSNSLNRIRRDVLRFADPERLKVADALDALKDNEMQDLLASVILPKVGDPGTTVDYRPELEAERERSESERQARRKPTIVSERPMTAKASETHAYASPTTIERTWSDGTIDYKCVDCDYTAIDRLSVRGHYSSHRKGVQQRPPTVPMLVPEAATYAPRKDRVEALAQAMLELGPGATLADLARHALMWVHEQSHKGSRLAAEREELTAEETLQRIKTLLDDGAGLKIVELSEQVQTLNARLAEAEVFAVEKAEQARQARETLKAFTDLANELAQTEERTAV